MKKIIFALFFTFILATMSQAKPGDGGQKMGTIGIVIFEFGDVDGVSLETVKIIKVLKRLGFEVKIFTGQLHYPEKFNGLNVYVDKRATFRDETSFAAIIQDRAFKYKWTNLTSKDEFEMKQMVESAAGELTESISNWVARENIDIIMAQNSMAIPVHLPLGVAIGRIIRKQKVPFLNHHHDFPWERDFYMNTHYGWVKQYIKHYFPGDFQAGSALTINRHNHDLVAREMGMETVLTPNVMDFNDPKFAKRDEYNSDMLKELGIPEDVRILGQMTRVVPRKNIEASLELLSKLKRLNKKKRGRKTVLVVTGEDGIGDGADYSNILKAKMKRLGLIVDKDVFFVSDRVKDERGEIKEGKHINKIYSLSDMYAYLNKQGMMTYPSTYEGFGNALIEGMAAKVAIVGNPYSVFREDIRPRGVKIIEMDNGRVTKKIAKQVDKTLDEVISGEGDIIKQIESNFEIGKKYFSYETLREKLSEALVIMKRKYYEVYGVDLKLPNELLSFMDSREVTSSIKDNLCQLAISK